MRHPVKAASLAQLSSRSNPQSVPGGQSQAVPWLLYDTATYVSGATTQLTFFTTTRANAQLSNLNGGGLPTPQYFDIWAFTLDILTPAGNNTPLEDTSDVTRGTGTAGEGAPTWQFTLADKVTGPFPLYSLHGVGGIEGFTTQTTTEYANNGRQSGTFWADGAITIPPNQSFSIVLTWPAAVTLSASRDLVIGMVGTLHRRIL